MPPLAPPPLERGVLPLERGALALDRGALPLEREAPPLERGALPPPLLAAGLPPPLPPPFGWAAKPKASKPTELSDSARPQMNAVFQDVRFMTGFSKRVVRYFR